MHRSVVAWGVALQPTLSAAWPCFVPVMYIQVYDCDSCLPAWPLVKCPRAAARACGGIGGASFFPAFTSV